MTIFDIIDSEKTRDEKLVLIDKFLEYKKNQVKKIDNCLIKMENNPCYATDIFLSWLITNA